MSSCICHEFCWGHIQLTLAYLNVSSPMLNPATVEINIKNPVDV